MGAQHVETGLTEHAVQLLGGGDVEAVMVC